MKLEIDKIKQANTKWLGKEILYQEEMESTQEMANEIKNQKENGTILILTDNQTKGKGTKERKWHTVKEQNITMTLLLYPNCTVEALEGLTRKIAETMVQTIQQLYHISLQIKEPNDILLHTKKIGGILTQASSYQNRVKSLIIGVGFNVNQVKFAPPIEPIATSLKKEYQREFNKEEIIISFLEMFEKVLEKSNIIEEGKKNYHSAIEN